MPYKFSFRAFFDSYLPPIISDVFIDNWEMMTVISLKRETVWVGFVDARQAVRCVRLA